MTSIDACGAVHAPYTPKQEMEICVPMTIDTQTADTIARLILAAGDAAMRILPVTGERGDFDLAAGYDVGARVARLRQVRGERVAGWKIGFTNKNIWAEYGADAPIWGPMYDTTIIDIGDAGAECEAARFAEPRIEPEIALRLSATPMPDMDEAALLTCIDGVTHGFEVVQSIFPGWSFKAPDTVAAFGLHGCFCHRGFVPVEAGEPWLDMLNGFEIALLRNGEEVDRGVAANVLGGPLSALAHFIEGLARDPLGRALQPGDIVTTGTVTRAFPVEAGERWSTRITGLPLSGVELAIT